MNLPKFLWVLPSDKSSGHQVPHRNPWSGSTSDQYSWPTTVNTRLSTNILALAKVKSQWAFVASLPGYGIKAFRCEKGCGFVLSGTTAWNWVLLLNNLPLENRDSGLNRVGKITQIIWFWNRITSFQLSIPHTHSAKYSRGIPHREYGMCLLAKSEKY